MEQNVATILAKKDHPKEVGELLTTLKGLVKMSRSAMRDYYNLWDRNDSVYRGERAPDESDRKAIKRSEPMKVVVPLSNAQIQTFVSFNIMMFTQRDYFYEISGSGIEDESPAKLAQAVIERDLDHNAFKGVLLPQWLTDVGRYGIGIMKSDWVRDTCPKMMQVPDPAFVQQSGMQQVQPPMINQMQDVTEYLGNRIKVTSPYKWFPDTRLPITRYREGEFCADECEQSLGELKRLEKQGICVGTAEIPQMGVDVLEDRRFTIINKSYLSNQPSNDSRYCVLTEVQVRLNPSKTKISETQVLNKEIDAEVLYLVWIANDRRIIRIEEMGYDHNQFTWDAAQYFNDQSRLLNFGLAELLGPSQDIMDWLMNSRVTNVRKVIQNQLVVDPRYINMDDLKDRNPILRLKSTAQGLSIDSYIKQLAVTDVTTGHLTDMGVVSDFAKQASGISDNLLGQYATGRRSAREASNVNNNAAARLQVIASGLWESALLPLGKKLISNSRQGLDEQQLIRIVGLQRYVKDASAVQAFMPLDKSMLYGSYDFLIFNATLPSQRMATAQALQELLVAMAKDPKSIFVFQKDPKLILDEVLELRGIHNAERFDLTPERAQQFMLMAGAAPNPAVPSGTPGAVPSNGQPG